MKRQKLETSQSGLLDDESIDIRDILTSAVSRVPMVGGLLAEIVDPPEANAGASIIYGPEREGNFERWFRNSKVIDAKGNPKVMYHGTNAPISEFLFEFTNKGNDQLGSGFYFTDTPSEASGYAEDNAGNVMPVYLSVQNPLDEDQTGNLTESQVRRFIKNAPKYKQRLTDWGDVQYEGERAVLDRAVNAYTRTPEDGPLLKGLFQIANDFYGDDIQKFNEQVTKILKFDGVRSKKPYGATHIMGFQPNQIKSIYNRGTFDPEDPDILSYREEPIGLLSV
jgi:hypothetical protein